MKDPLMVALVACKMKDDETRDLEAMEAKITAEVDAFLASEDMVGVLGRSNTDFTRIFAKTSDRG